MMRPLPISRFFTLNTPLLIYFNDSGVPPIVTGVIDTDPVKIIFNVRPIPNVFDTIIDHGMNVVLSIQES